jgi:hypothetical protein
VGVLSEAIMMRLCAALLLLALSACAAPDGVETSAGASAQAGRDCVDMGLVTGYEAVDRDTVRLRAGPSTEYDVDLIGAQCNTVEWSQRIAIESTPSSWVCVGNRIGQGRIYFRDSAVNRRVSCYIGDVRRVPAATANNPN